MKSRTLAFAALLLITAFLLMQAIAPHVAVAGTAWTNTPGAGTSDAPTVSRRASSANVMKLAFIRNGDVYIYSIDTGEARKLTNSGNVT